MLRSLILLSSLVLLITLVQFFEIVDLFNHLYFSTSKQILMTSFLDFCSYEITNFANLFFGMTGDNIFGHDSSDSAKSMDAAFAPAIESNIPWVAVLGNHDQEGSLSREGLMKYIVGLNNSLSKVNPPEVHIIDGFGNNNLEVGGVQGTAFENKSVLNLYFLDSGDYSKVPTIPDYDWIKPSQQLWFQQTSAKLRVQSRLLIILSSYITYYTFDSKG